MDQNIKTAFIDAGVDVDDCLNRLMNKEDLFFRFMNKFLEDDNLEKLKNAVNEGNVEAAFGAAHTLKGVASNLSLAGILEPLVPFVEILRSGSLDGADEAIAKIEENYNKIITQIKTV